MRMPPVLRHDTAFVSTAPQRPDAAPFVPGLDMELDPFGRSLSPQEEGSRYFQAMLDPERTLRSVLAFYINYHGSINWGLQNVLVEQVRMLAGPEAAAFTRRDVLGKTGELAPAFLERFAPDMLAAYFVPSGVAVECEILKGPAANEWRDETFPKGVNHRMRQAERPPFSLLSVSGFEVFASTYGYQLFDPQRGVYLPDVCSRSFPRSVQFYQRREISAPLVIVQDEFDGGNFAHFLFDWLPRILYFAERHPRRAARSRHCPAVREAGNGSPPVSLPACTRGDCAA